MWPKHETPANVFLRIAMVVKVDTVWNEEMMQLTLEEATPFLLAGYFVIARVIVILNMFWIGFVAPRNNRFAMHNHISQLT